MLDKIENQLHDRGIIKKKFDYENLPTYYTNYFKTNNLNKGFYETEMKIRNDPNFIPTYSYTQLSNMRNADLIERQKIQDTNLIATKEFEVRKLIEHELEPYLQNIRLELKNTIEDFKKEFQNLNDEKKEIENMKNIIRENNQFISKIDNDFQYLKNDNNEKYNYLKSQIENKNNNLFNELNSKFLENDVKLEQMNKKLNDNKKIIELENKFTDLIDKNQNNIFEEINKIKKENQNLKNNFEQIKNINNNGGDNNNNKNRNIDNLILENNNNKSMIKELNKNLNELNSNFNNFKSEKNSEILYLKNDISNLKNKNKDLETKINNFIEYQVPRESNVYNEKSINEEKLNNLQNEIQNQVNDVLKNLTDLINNIRISLENFKNEQVKSNDISGQMFNALITEINNIKKYNISYYKDNEENIDQIEDYINKIAFEEIPNIQNNIGKLIIELNNNNIKLNEEMQKGFDENSKWQKELVENIQNKLNEITENYDNRFRQTLSLNDHMINTLHNENVINNNNNNN